MALPRPSVSLRITFPTNPSHITTSALPFGRSFGSIFPMKFKSVALNNSVVSFTREFPFPFSDPTLRRAIRGWSFW